MPDDTTQLLSKYKGKIILVEFLLTTCPHCQRCSQVVEKMYKEFGPKGFQPIGVAINDMAKMLIPDFKKNGNLTWPVGFSPRDPVYSYLEHPAMQQLYMRRWSSLTASSRSAPSTWAPNRSSMPKKRTCAT